MEIIGVAKKAVEAFESDKEDRQDIFEKYAKLLYNNFAQNPIELSQIQSPYLIGIVYSYLEGGFKESDITQVCFDNACYCFAKVIKNGKSASERISAAIRLFLLMNEVGARAFNLCNKVFEQNCQQLKGVSYAKYRTSIGQGEFISEIRLKVRDIGDYCYSLFSQGLDSSFISVEDMSRVNGFISDYNTRLLTFEEYEFKLKDMFFKMFIEYLECDVLSYSTARIKQI
jgi:hypothetical protein